MKKILLSFLAVFLIGALVISCDSNAKNISDETATVSFATSMGRSLSAQVSYIGFDQLDWEYQATLASDTGFTYGQTVWAPINLSDTREFSQGLWKFELRAKTKGEDPQEVYYGYKDGVLIKKQSTPVPVLINVSPVSGGTGAISFETISIVGKNEGETKIANKALITGDNTSIEVALPCEKQVVPAGSYSVVVSCVNQYGTVEEYVVSASETIDVQVFSGADVLISGDIAEGTQSAIFNPSLEVPETTFAKQLPVSITNNSDDEKEVTVREEKEIKNDTLVVTYPEGTLLKDANVDDETKTADAVTGVKYVGDTLSEASLNKHVSLQSNEGSVAHYQLTLNVADTNSVYLTVNMSVEKNLAITRVLHNGVALYETSGAPSTVDPEKEYYSYNKEDGILTLYVFHASPIEIFTAKTSHLPANAKLVSTLAELENAVENLHDGDYIAFVSNIVQDKVDTTSGQITFAKASDATGSVEATLDLNGFVFDGQIGGFSFNNNDVKVIIHGTDKTVADYYEHETGHHMVKACAVFLYSGSYEIKDGLFKSNNIVMMAYGGHTDITGGIFEQTEEGVCIFACNDPSMTIDYAQMSCGDGGAIFLIEPYRENKGPVITINGGVYDASKAAAVFVVDEEESDANEVGSFIVNGGQFTLGEDTDLFQGVKGSRLVIKGGTFNVNPSDYVAEGYEAVKDESKGTWTVSKTSSN